MTPLFSLSPTHTHLGPFLACKDRPFAWKGASPFLLDKPSFSSLNLAHALPQEASSITLFSPVGFYYHIILQLPVCISVFPLPPRLSRPMFVSKALAL